MQESKRQELLDELPNNDYTIQEEYDRIIQDLKPKINAMCYANVPPSMTMKEFEWLTIGIFKLIDEEWQKKLKAGALHYEQLCCHGVDLVDKYVPRTASPIA